MKNRIVKKILRIILLVLVGAAVIGTFYFLWKKAQPVITVYEIVRRCVKILTFFFMPKAPTFTSWGFVIT